MKDSFGSRTALKVAGREFRIARLGALEARGVGEDGILTIPENVGGRYSVFTLAGLLPAAIMGLDIRAILLGAALFRV